MASFCICQRTRLREALSRPNRKHTCQRLLTSLPKARIFQSTVPSSAAGQGPGSYHEVSSRIGRIFVTNYLQLFR